MNSTNKKHFNRTIFFIIVFLVAGTTVSCKSSLKEQNEIYNNSDYSNNEKSSVSINESNEEISKKDVDLKEEKVFVKSQNDRDLDELKEKDEQSISEELWKTTYFQIIKQMESYIEPIEEFCHFSLVDVDGNQVPELFFFQDYGARGFCGEIHVFHFTNGELQNLIIDTSSMYGCNGLFEVYKDTKTNEQKFLFNMWNVDYPEFAIDIQQVYFELENNKAWTETVIQTGQVQYPPERQLAEEELMFLTEYLHFHEKVEYFSLETINFKKISEVEMVRYGNSVDELPINDDMIHKFIDSWWSEL